LDQAQKTADYIFTKLTLNLKKILLLIPLVPVQREKVLPKAKLVPGFVG